MSRKGYEMVEYRTVYELFFYFISSGRKNVMKVIEFENMGDEEGNLFNLGFGDYDFESTGYDDNSKTGNNDGRKVFDFFGGYFNTLTRGPYIAGKNYDEIFIIKKNRS